MGGVPQSKSLGNLVKDVSKVNQDWSCCLFGELDMHGEVRVSRKSASFYETRFDCFSTKMVSMI